MIKKKIRNILLILISVMILIALLICLWIASINRSITLQCNDTNTKNVTYHTTIPYVYVTNQTIDCLINHQKNLQVTYKNTTITYQPKQLKNKLQLNLSITQKKSSIIPQMKDLEYVSISQRSFDEVTVDTNNYPCLKDHDVLDLYLYDKDQNLTFIKKVYPSDDLVTIKHQEDCKEYCLLYIPVQSIQVKDTHYIVGSTYSIEPIFTPNNATNKNYDIKLLEDEQLITLKDKNLEAIKTGSSYFSMIHKDLDTPVKVDFSVTNYMTAISVPTHSMNLYVDDSKNLTYTIVPNNAQNKEDITILSSNPEIVAIEDHLIRAKSIGTCSIIIKNTSGNNVESKITITVKEKPIVTTATPTYIDGILIVNKTYPLPSSYNPGLQQVTIDAFNQLKAAASLDGIHLSYYSGFRSYNYQASIYDRYCRQDGQTMADTYSARPGHSEHQSGLALDITDSVGAYDYIAKYGHLYGFIVRYPKGKTNSTGYMYEPWHIRYVGKEFASKIYYSGLCVEEYLGITSAYTN